ncbi:MAG: dipeptide epimerase [Leptolyngbyaceae cyanobacterium SM1_1_3]|nr:dipeptide epimerase [Leptolyngbyaceae cyanobacterium SM1_1_3]NJN03184.1 dipeptide epimerase [Leptolyngbyaceae cyanobacterium RM1_1_2]NJO08895.1 dipeptide epimerase [Leptolyngbyaceae cyanobacterium SL_1_1]
MQIEWQTFTVHKRVPLTISRGTHASSTNLWLRLSAERIEGWGEATPFSIGNKTQPVETIAAELTQIRADLERLHPLQHQAIADLMQAASLSLAARTALDVALHDWLGKRVGLPLWQLWGLERDRIGPTAVTIGIDSPSAAVERLQDWLALFPARSIKVKLGSPAGIEADRFMMNALLENIPPQTKVSIDANGGWTLAEAVKMSDWLAERGVAYLEQPLAAERLTEFAALYQRSPLPIFADESCFSSQDIPRLADCVHGINIKLMKAGGLSEVRRMIAVARAFKLQVMFGCYSDSILSNTALAHLAPLADHLDLDSHLNLKNDPFQGASLNNSCLYPNLKPGLGVIHALKP